MSFDTNEWTYRWCRFEQWWRQWPLRRWINQHPRLVVGTAAASTLLLLIVVVSLLTGGERAEPVTSDQGAPHSRPLRDRARWYAGRGAGVRGHVWLRQRSIRAGHRLPGNARTGDPGGCLSCCSREGRSRVGQGPARPSRRRQRMGSGRRSGGSRDHRAGLPTRSTGPHAATLLALSRASALFLCPPCHTPRRPFVHIGA